MPKINVYLPDDLAEAVRESGLPVSAICQRSLEQAVRRMATIREAVFTNLDREALADRLPSFTPRLVSALILATDRAKDNAAATVTSGDLLHGMLAEGSNLAVRILTAMDIAPESLTAPATREAAPSGTETAPDALRFSLPAAVVLELAVGEAIGFGHNYVGCEHLLVGLVAEPDGAAGALLRSRGADARATRRAVTAAVAGYAAAPKPTPAGLLAAIRGELAPLIERIKRLESRLG